MTKDKAQEALEYLVQTALQHPIEGLHLRYRIRDAEHIIKEVLQQTVKE